VIIELILLLLIYLRSHIISSYYSSGRRKVCLQAIGTAVARIAGQLLA